MRQILFIITCLFCCNSFAQKLSVESMTALPMDLSASQYERKDLNGQPCALVKVQLATMGARFEGNVVGSADYKTNEYWVYMTEGSYMLSVKHPNFVTLSVNFRDYGISGLQGKTTYRLTLLMPQAGPMNIDDGMRYLTLIVSPANSKVTIDGQMQNVDADGSVSVYLPQGIHSYSVESAGYASKSGRVTLSSESVTERVTLESVLATVQVSCPTSGAQIYVNNQLKGTTPWSGTLAAGNYQMEARLSGYRSQKVTESIAERANRQITIPALQAIVGNLNVNYKPAQSEVWMDGRRLGSTPDVFRNLLVGQHQVEIRKEGYTTKKETVTIADVQTAMLTGSLERQQTAQSQNQVQTTVSSASGSAIETITVNGVSFNMVRVDGGTFTMGATAEQGSDVGSDEKPTHQVTLSSYSIGETEVTQALWQAVMGSNPSKYKGTQKPVEQVSWNDCQEFIQNLNQLTGRKFRLPTEAEWEYAARGGSKSRGYKYSGSNNIDDVAWYTTTTNDKGTRNVKTKQANELGLYDMSGNVWEWCQDWYGSYSSGAQTNPTGALSGSRRVFRGGSWNYYASYCRSSYRYYFTPTSWGHNLGLRLAL